MFLHRPLPLLDRLMDESCPRVRSLLFLEDMTNREQAKGVLGTASEPWGGLFLLAGIQRN